MILTLRQRLSRLLLLSCLVALCLPSTAHATPPTAPTFTNLFQTIPTAQTNSAYNASSTATHYNLHWTDNSTDEDFFDIWIKIGEAFQWQHYRYAVKNASFNYVIQEIANLTTPAMAQGTLVSFRIYACKGVLSANGVDANVSERSAASTELSAPLDTSPEASFTAPSSFAVTAIPGTDGRLRFVWTDNSDKEEENEIYFKETVSGMYGTSPALILNFGNKAQEITAPLVPGTSYTWKMRARRATAYQVVGSNLQAVAWDFSPYSNETVVVMPALIAPTNLTAVAKNERTVTLAWTDNSQNRTSYVIEYRTPVGSGSFVELGPTGATSTVDVDWYPNLNTEWRIKAAFDSNPRVFSTPSNTITLKLPFNVPTNLQAVITGVEATLAGTATLTWTDNSSIETGYYILRRPTLPANGQFAVIKTINTANTTTTTVPTTPDGGVSYDYQVVTFYTVGANTFESDPSNTTIGITKDRITSNLNLGATKNTALSPGYQITTTMSSPRTSTSATGLPAGLMLDSALGSITGTPTVSGLFNVALSATFTDGFIDRKILVLRVAQPPTAPTTPLLVTSRTVGIATVIMPLTTGAAETSMFLDTDAESAVRITTSLGNSFDIILQPSITPETCANFLAYVNAHEYDGVSFHRVSPGFVLQGGGYKPLVAEGANKYEQIAARPSPVNEPGLANVIGTVAMARSSGINSATHDFFVNLADNRSILDNSNGGFTAFGRVAGNGMATTINAINAKPGRADYTISVRQAGSTTYQNIQPIADPGLGGGTKWPLDDASELSAMDNTKAITMTAATVPTLAFLVTNNTDTSKVTAVAVGSNLQLTGLADGDSDITVQATDLDGNVTSQTITVHVQTGFAAPSINTHPVAQTITEGSNVTFTVAATGTSLTYQWKKNGVNIGSATNASYSINNVQTSDVGDYTLLVSNEAGFVLSNVAHLTVRVPVHINPQPLAQSLNYFQPLALSVAATGDPTITYQWKKGNTNINGETNSSFTIAHLLMTDDADYSVDVTNPLGTVSSSVVHVTVNPIDTDGDGLYDHQETAPSIITLTGVVITNGSAVVTITPNSALHAGMPISGTGIPVGATIQSVGVTDPTKLTLSSAATQTIASGTLYVTADPTLPDPTKADTDGDGFADGIEIGAGTDPANASSKPNTITTFFAQRDGAALLNSIGFKRLLGASVPTRTTDVTIANFWFAKKELTNKEFAAVLQRAKQDGLISITTESSRRVVRYPKAAGEIVCYLATPIGATPPSCDVDLDTIGSSFTVPIAKQNTAACAITWHGAYLCSAVLNAVQGYTTKNVTATWSYNFANDGYYIPRYSEWELAGRGISPTYVKPGLVYPTGASASTSLAFYNQLPAITSPKDVGKYVANRLGLYDLAGNVEEWIYEGTDTTHAFTRGGSFADPATELLNTADESLPLSTISRQVGVRLALKAPDRATISTQPVAKFQATSSPLTLTVTATGVPPLTYQWYKNNVALAGKTSATLSITAPTTANAGNYLVKVFSQGINPVSSNSVPVALVDAHATPPLTTIAFNRGTAFQTKVVGAAVPAQTFSYQWKMGTTNLTADANFSGVTSSKLVMTTMLPGHSGIYTCQVSLNGQTTLPPVNTSFELLVLQRPLIMSVTFGTLVVSGSVDVPIVMDSDPTRKASSFTISGLPPGLTFNPITGRVTGKPLVNGGFTLTITATNSAGSSLPYPVTLFVNALPGGATGTFAGIVARSASPTLNNNLGGRLDITIATNGKYTGKVTLAGALYLVSGVLDAKDPTLSDHNPTSIITIARTGKPSLQILFKIDLNTLRFIPTETVNSVQVLTSGVRESGTGGGASATLTGWRLIWSNTNPANGYQSNRMNLSLTPPTNDVNLIPQGTGYATLSTDYNTGTTTFTGKLPDGTATTSSAFLSPLGGDIMHFQILYANTGSLLGFMKQAPSVDTISAISPLSWFKKAQAVTSTARTYKAGFDTTLGVVGQEYRPPTVGSIFGGLPAPSSATNARLTFTSGGIGLPAPALPSTSTSLIKDFQIDTAQVIHILNGIIDNPYTVTCKIDKSTGAISGTFVLTDNDPTSTALVPAKIKRTVNWYGLVIPGSTTTTVGFFTLPKLPNLAPNAHTISNSEILSGRLTLSASP